MTATPTASNAPYGRGATTSRGGRTPDNYGRGFMAKHSGHDAGGFASSVNNRQAWIDNFGFRPGRRCVFLLAPRFRPAPMPS